jgi:hypothetical protein
MTAGSDTGNGRARSLTETLCWSRNCASKARRVGSASAEKVRSRTVSLYLTIRLSNMLRETRCQGDATGAPAAQGTGGRL